MGGISISRVPFPAPLMSQRSVLMAEKVAADSAPADPVTPSRSADEEEADCKEPLSRPAVLGILPWASLMGLFSRFLQMQPANSKQAHGVPLIRIGKTVRGKIADAPTLQQRKKARHVILKPFYPGETPASRQMELLFDNLVGELLKAQRHFEAERLGGLQVDTQLELDWCLRRQIGWLLAFENAIDVGGRAPDDIDCVGSV
jgi:hypothetical protein